MKVQNRCEAHQYPKAFDLLNDIPSEYSQYDGVLELYEVCKEQTLQTVEDPISKEQFDEFLQLLEKCIEQYDAPIFIVKKSADK